MNPDGAAATALRGFLVRRNNERREMQRQVMLPISRSYLPSLPRWEFPFFAFDGPEFSSRRLRPGGLNFFPSRPVPCESVILVWYQRNSRAACLLSFRCNNERRGRRGKGDEKDGRRERRESSTTYPPYFPLQRLSLPPIETKPQVLPYFPSVFPLLSCKSFLRECSPIIYSTIAHSASSLLSFLSLASPAWCLCRNNLFAYYILNGFRILHVLRAGPVICTVEAKRKAKRCDKRRTKALGFFPSSTACHVM